MTKIIKLLTILISFLFVSSYVFATSETSSNWYNQAIFDWSIEFKAELDGNNVYTKWTTYDKGEWFQFYKIIRSDSVENPIYPDNGYIEYYTDVNKTEYVDYNPLYGSSYYRVCAITYENNRYCSNVVKIYREKTDSDSIICTMEYAPVCWYKDWEYKTYWNKCMLNWADAIYKYSWECKNTNSSLSLAMKSKADELISNLILKIENKYNNSESRLKSLNNIIYKLEALKDKNSSDKFSSLLDYLIQKLKDRIQEYEDIFWDIENIFSDY